VAHVARKTAFTSTGHSANDHDNNLQPHLRAAAARVSHPTPNMSHIFRARKHSDQVVCVTKAIETVHGTLTLCSEKVGQTGPKHSSVIHSFSCTDRVSAPHRLRGVHIGAFLDQSLDNLRVPILGSPHQGRPALLRDDRTSIGCSLAPSDKADDKAVLKDRF
jgi:hypothetical protein